MPPSSKNREAPMEHHTTLNLELSTYEELKTLADLKDISVSRVIVALMKFLSKEVEHRKMPERLVEYQKLSKGEEWFTCHVYLSFSEHQHFVDMRNFLKMSVSFLVSYAVRKYGTLILDFSPEEFWDDKNLLPHYSFGKKTVSGQQYFIICWGKTAKYPDMNSPT